MYFSKAWHVSVFVRDFLCASFGSFELRIVLMCARLVERWLKVVVPFRLLPPGVIPQH